MNKRAYLAHLLTFVAILSIILKTAPITSPILPVDATVPWPSTFAGINAPTIPQQSTSSSPFQAATAPTPLQNQQQANNPFAVSTDSVSVQAIQSTPKSIIQILTNPNTPLSQKINGMFTKNTTIGGQPMKVTPQTKYRIPPAAQTLAQLNGISFTQGQMQINHPQSLFPNNPVLKQAYNNFMNALKDVPSFFPLFRKIHITALHQIYLHLIGVYTSLNMTHMDDLKTYMATEKKYALNKKTLIINHLINVVMAQLNQSLRALIPGLPENYAIATGMGCIQADKVSNPDILVLDIEEYVLSTLGLEKINETQTSLAYLGIRRYLPLIGMQVTPELETALTHLNTTPFSAKNMTKEEATLLSTIMYKILAYLNQEQNVKDITRITELLRGSTTQIATSQEVTLFAGLITEFCYEKLLMGEIEFTKRLADLLGDGDSVSTNILPQEYIQCLKNIISWILKQYGKVFLKKTTIILTVLGELNPTYQRLSPSQSIALKTLAIRMLGSNTNEPVLLEDISDSNRALLAYGLWTTSNNEESLLSASEKTIIKSIAIPLKKHSLSMEGLTKDQQMCLEKALVEYSTYTLKLDGDKTKAALNALTSGGKTHLESAFQILSSPNFSTLNKLPKEDQILIMQLFQTMDQFMGAFVEINKIKGSPVQYLLENSSHQITFLENITINKFLVLMNINEFLKKHPIISFKTFVDMRPYGGEVTMDPLKALRDLFEVSPSQKSKTTPNVSYSDILRHLKREHVQNETTAAFIKSIKEVDILLYRMIFPLLTKPNFTFDQIDPGTRAAIADSLTAYKKSLIQNRSIKYTRTPNNNDPTQHALETLADYLSYSQQFHSKRTSFLWVLKEYLVFFNLYAQTLQTVSHDPHNPSYVGLTQFADYAKNIRQELAYESASNNTIAALLQKANPPLFFYNENTFRGIRLLPKLAMEIENSPTPIAIAPFPTFGIEQASSATGTATDPLNGKTVSNSTSIGSFSYQKFFFLQAPDSVTELTGSLPSWIKKTTVPSLKGTTFIYEPNAMPADGITGFYMNIPVFSQDPAHKNSMLIRLFEQPIIAQPAWLNKSGTGQKTPKSGVIPAELAGSITLLRGCLGDFQSLLDLNIFDPCLTVIFSSALALSDNDLDAKTSTNLIKDKKGKCAAYMKEKKALIAHQENPKATINANVLGKVLQSQGTSILLPSSTLTNAEPMQETSTPVVSQ